MTEIQKFSDAAMFDAAPISDKEPKVHLLWMTPDPLGAIAAACRMYEGYPTYDLADITDEDRLRYFEQVQKTHLKAPLEFVQFHFFIEGVDRAFTHQMVRQRTAVFAQESMRFAVKGNMKDEVPLPPSISKGSSEEKIWRYALDCVQFAYDKLIEQGVPAEDARGLLPHATLTRLNFNCNLRSLLDHAGNRLCTQAQFAWRKVFSGMANAITNYGSTTDHVRGQSYAGPDSWQFEKLASLFQPVCYQMGKCPFKADFDRGCTIRDRVDKNEKLGRPSSEWHRDGVEFTTVDRDALGDVVRPETVEAINPAEWLLFHDSAYVKPGDKYGDQSHRRKG